MFTLTVSLISFSQTAIIRGIFVGGKVEEKISTQSGGGDVTVIECEYNPSEICYTFNGDVLVKKTMVRNQKSSLSPRKRRVQPQRIVKEIT